MELLLNVTWAALALGAVLAFLSRGHSATDVRPGAHLKSLIALASIICLLFPIVSASDDLHPTQAVLEDATKRIQRTIVPVHLLNSPHIVWLWLPALLSLALSFGLMLLCPRYAIEVTANVIGRRCQPKTGRAPPSMAA